MTLAVAGDDIPKAQALLDERWRSALDKEQEHAANIVLDFSANTMTCPACLTEFKTGPSECPECELFLGN